MALTWFAPLMVLGIGSLLVAVLLVRLHGAGEDLRGALVRFGRVEPALIPVRVETRRARVAIDHRPRQ